MTTLLTLLVFPAGPALLLAAAYTLDLVAPQLSARLVPVLRDLVASPDTTTGDDGEAG